MGRISRVVVAALGLLLAVACGDGVVVEEVPTGIGEDALVTGIDLVPCR